MNENNNNPFNNDMPKPINSNEEKKPIIEIPQAYYDKVAAEQHEKFLKEQEEKEQMQKRLANKGSLNKLISLVIVNALLIFGLLYSMINFNSLIIIGIPVYIVILAIIEVVRSKNNSDQPLANLIGGMLVAVVTFVISMVRESEMDLWTYYAIASAIISFLGFLISTIITKIFTDFKSIKALSAVGIILFFALIIGGPFYFYKKYPEEFFKIVFLKQTEVHAETEEEFILKTLKNRYSVEFTCNNEKVRHYINQYSQKITKRTCYDSSQREVNVFSTTYNESENQFIISDDYMDIIYLTEFKTKLSNTLKSNTGANSVKLYLYPEKNCTFVGDCAECDEYFESYDEENDFSNQFNNSTQLNLSNYLNKNVLDFVNDYKFKYIINVLGNYTETSDFNAIINTVLTSLNSSGLKNNYGYDIKITDENTLQGYELIRYEVKGQKTDDGVFKDPVVVEKEN